MAFVIRRTRPGGKLHQPVRAQIPVHSEYRGAVGFRTVSKPAQRAGIAIVIRALHKAELLGGRRLREMGDDYLMRTFVAGVFKGLQAESGVHGVAPEKVGATFVNNRQAVWRGRIHPRLL